MFLIIFSILFACFGHDVRSTKVSNDLDTLKLVFSVIRHGERTSELPSYPTDPYNNITYYPYGPGMTTNFGTERQYEVGLALRKKYQNLLGNDYYDDAVIARSSDLKRTKASLLALLSGLYPPKGINIWSDHYSLANYWQPIPIIVKPLANDLELAGLGCPRFVRLFNEYKQTENFQSVNNQYKELLNFLEKETGITPFPDITLVRGQLITKLASQKLYGLKLPEWAEKVFPDKLEGPTVDTYLQFAATPVLRKLVIGFFLKEIIDETIKKKNGENRLRKMYLYNCSEFNLATLLIALKVYDRKIPNFNSYINIEVHEIEGEYALRVLYQNYKYKDPEVLTIPGCSAMCSFKKFLELVSDSIPGQNDTCR